MQNTFSFRASLKKSWSVFKTNWVLLVGGLVGYYIINLAFSWFAEFLNKNNVGITGIIVSLIGSVITFVILLGYYMIGLQLLENKKAPITKDNGIETLNIAGTLKKILLWKISWNDIFHISINIPNKLLGTAIVVQIIRTIIMVPIVIIVGTLFFITGWKGNLLLSIIIGIVGLIAILYIQLRTGFTVFLSIDHYETMKPWSIIKHAWKITKGKEWLIVMFVIKIVLLNIIGALALGIGLLITLPLSLLVAVDFYRTHINPKTESTEPVHTDMVVKSPEIEAPEIESETSETVMDSETIPQADAEIDENRSVSETI